MDGAIRFCIDRKSGQRCNDAIDKMLRAYQEVRPAIEKEIKSLNLDKAKARLGQYRQATVDLARAAKGHAAAAVPGKTEKAPEEKAASAHNALRKAVTEGDASVCEMLFNGGLDPNESGNAWILFESFIDKNPASLQILDAAVKNGFDVNREIEIAQGDALAFMSKQRERLDKWFSADGDLEEQKLLAATDAGSDANSLNLGAILALINIESDPELESVADKYGLNMAKGVELRSRLHAAYKDAFSSVIAQLNAFIKKENEIYGKLQTLKNCKNLDKYRPEEFDNTVQTPFGSTLFPATNNVYDEIAADCRYTRNYENVNELIDGLKMRFPEKTKEFQEKLSRLKIKDVTARLNEYKKATIAIGRLGQ